MPPVAFVPLYDVRLSAGTRDTHGTHVRDQESRIEHKARWFAHLRIVVAMNLSYSDLLFLHFLCR